MTNPDRFLPWAMGSAAALFYLCFHSTFYNFDGVACAIAVELGDLRHLAHGNHLAYGLVGLAWDRAWRLLGYGGPALLCLQTLDSMLGGLGVGLFCMLLRRRLKLSAFPTAAASAGLALSYAWWLWSLEAQVYMLGAVFLILAADEALADQPVPWKAGLYHGLAVLGHAGNAMFLFCALFLLREPAGRTTAGRWLRYLGALAAAVLSAYAAAALCCVQPRDGNDLRLWLLGSAALGVDRSFQWHGGPPLANLVSWLGMTLRIFADPVSLAPPWTYAGWTLAALGLAAAGAGWQAGARIGRACLLWLGSYALLFYSWEPCTMVYRVTDLIPFWILAALFASKSPWRARALASWVAVAGSFNGFFLIYPRTVPLNNREYQEARWLGEATPPESWIIATGNAQVYVPYFAGRKPLNMRYFEGRPEALRQRLAQLRAQDLPIYATARMLALIGPALLRTLQAEGLSQTARGPGGALYRIGMNGNPSGSRQKKQNTAPAAKNGPKGTGSDMRKLPRATRPTP